MRSDPWTESETCELKKSLAELKEGLISIVAILNKHGAGELWFGVAPNGKAVGLDVTDKTLRDLSQAIAAHIEPQVVEIFGEWQGEGAAAWAAAHAHALCQRCEVSGETAFCYTTDAAPLLAHLAHLPGLRSLHRPANLEDVFLKLTGRDLRD